MKVLYIGGAGRAVAYSWDKRRKRKAASAEVVYMPHHSPTRSIITWCYENMMMRYFGRKGDYYATLRYEDMTQSPNKAIGDTLHRLGIEADLNSSEPAIAHSTHSVGGNPMRFSSINQPIVIDDEWKQKMHPRTKRLLSLIAAPVLHSFGYPISS